MNALLFIFLSALVPGAWLLVFAGYLRQRPAESLACAGLAACGQIIATETLLGVPGLLQVPWLTLLNAVLSGGLIGWTLLQRSAWPRHDPRAAGHAAWIPETRWLSWHHAALLALLAFFSLWIVIAAWLLPPRGIDDLGYHLPALYQWVQQGRFSLLPLELRSTFTYPFNADLLFLWPLVFLHDDTVVDLVQFAAALYGAVTLFALARAFDVARNSALFVALLFIFIPVVLGQAGSNYVDLIVAAWHLALLYTVVRHYQTGGTVYLLAAGCAAGLLLGAKYTAIVFVLAVQPVILIGLWRRYAPPGRALAYAAHWAVALPLCLYWYGRNLLATGHAFYPYRAGLTGLKPLPGTDIETAFQEAGVQLGSALATFLVEPLRFLQYLFADPGLGSFHGGFGPVFWGLAVPATVVSVYKAVRSARTGDLLPALFWAQAVITVVAFLAQMDDASFHLNQRYILIVVPFGLLALGQALQALAVQMPAAANVVRSLCIAGSLLSLVHLAGYQLPSYQVRPAVDDLLAGKRSSQYRYLEQTGFDLKVMSPAWDLLDSLTRPGGGWDVYMAVGWKVFWSAPTFGNRLQNRIINFAADNAEAPEAFFFHRFDSRGLAFIGRRITPEQVLGDGRYELLTQLPRTQLWVREDLLGQAQVRERLMAFYRLRFGPDMEQLDPVLSSLPANAMVITASAWGPGLKALSMSGRLALPVRLVPAGQELAAARRLAPRAVITLHQPLPGYQARALAQLSTPTSVVVIYENRLP